MLAVVTSTCAMARVVDGLGLQVPRRGQQLFDAHAVGGGLLFAAGLLLGVAMSPTLVYYAGANPRALWQAGGTTALFIVGSCCSASTTASPPRRPTSCSVSRCLALPASRYPVMAACGGSIRVLAIATPGHSRATFDGNDRDSRTIGGRAMSQIRITKQRRMADTRQRRQAEPLPLDPRDPDITRAKQLQRKRRPGVDR